MPPLIAVPVPPGSGHQAEQQRAVALRLRRQVVACMVRQRREVVERRAHVECRAARRIDKSEVDGDAARMVGADARVGDELRIWENLPEPPLRLDRAERIENAEPEAEGDRKSTRLNSSH